MPNKNFELLKNRWPQLYEHANFAEKYAHTDPHTAIIKLRCFAGISLADATATLKLVLRK